MHIILGGTGHVGSAAADALLARGQAVTIVSRFRQGNRLFLLNPPAPPSTDTAAEERKSLASIFRALEGSGLEKIVALSTYGAQPGSRIGDLGVLYEMEQGLANQPVPATIIRAAYLMSNWELSLPTARWSARTTSGELPRSCCSNRPQQPGCTTWKGPPGIPRRT
jgi:uncharacterized protein YbjT (DUF2867 family)